MNKQGNCPNILLDFMQFEYFYDERMINEVGSKHKFVSKILAKYMSLLHVFCANIKIPPKSMFVTNVKISSRENKNLDENFFVLLRRLF